MARIRKKRRSKSTKTKLRAIADRLLGILTRYAAADDMGVCQCVTCETQYQWNAKGMHAGHFISRRFAATRYMLANVHPQCYVCNVRLSGNPEAYLDWMTEEYGTNYVNWLRAERKLVVEQTVEYYHAAIDALAGELTELGFTISDDYKEVILDGQEAAQAIAQTKETRTRHKAALPAIATADRRDMR